MKKLRDGALTTSTANALQLLRLMLETNNELDFGAGAGAGAGAAATVVLGVLTSGSFDAVLQSQGLLLLGELLGVYPEALEEAVLPGAAYEALHALETHVEDEKVVQAALKLLTAIANNARADESSSVVTQSLMEVVRNLHEYIYPAMAASTFQSTLQAGANLFNALAKKAPSSVWAAADGKAMAGFVLNALKTKTDANAPAVIACIQALISIYTRSAGDEVRGLRAVIDLLHENMHALRPVVLLRSMELFEWLLRNAVHDRKLLEFTLAVMRKYGRDGEERHVQGDHVIIAPTVACAIVMQGMHILWALDSHRVHMNADEYAGLMRVLQLRAPLALLRLREAGNRIVVDFYNGAATAWSSHSARAAGGGTSRRSRTRSRSRSRSRPRPRPRPRPRRHRRR